jgi:hypothetical protein
LPGASHVEAAGTSLSVHVSLALVLLAAADVKSSK